MKQGAIVFVVNPKSANGATLRRFDRLRDRFAAALGDVEVRLTERPRHAVELTRDAIRAGARAVVAVGGDGTNNEVVNGFFDDAGKPLGEAAFGFVCSGTGGDFRRTFGQGTDPMEALERLKRCQTRDIDLGRLTFVDHQGSERSWMYLNSGSIGLVGVVVDIANRSSKALGPQVTFLSAALKGLFSYQPQRVRMHFDDDATPVEDAFLLVSMANGKFFGGGMKIAPNAEPDDGLLDCVMVKGAGAGLVRHMPKLYLGTHVDVASMVTVRRCKRVRIEPVDSKDRVLVELDGEQPGCLPGTFEAVPRALRLIA
ncbi:MAG: diacylglycerol kinase family lipid kinase [Deltaproteobacteria bacterium]|nr:diacylglycerol kinase family lipid kinase [Deltaproteobacteria bacterium]